MAEKVLMTALSPTMEVGTIAQWLKKENDSVASGDVLCEVETDKASMEYESAQEGTLLKIVRSAGQEAAIGDVIAIIGEKGEVIDDLLQYIAQARAAAPATQTTTAPAAVAETPPKQQSAPEPAAPAAAVATPVATPIAAAPATDGWVSSSPLARKIANDHNVAIGTITGSGSGGRVIKRDVEQALNAPAAAGARFIATPAVARGDTIVPLSGIRKVIAERTAQSMYSAPHYYVSLAIDMRSTIAARSTLNTSLKKQGKNKKVSFNAFIIKFAAEALRLFPEINATWQGTEIKQFGSIDIGLTVDLGNGLITPIIRDCARKGVVEIDEHLNALIEKVRTNSLKSEEYQGATHTISNLGSFGIDAFTAVINPPGAATWAIGKTAPTAVVDEQGQIVARPMMNTTLSCDHRVIDGKAAAEYLGTLKGFMENPASILY